MNQWAADHCHTLAGGQPILALDMYEHSYHIDYGAKAATYVDTFMNAIRWSNADELFARYAKVNDEDRMERLADQRSPCSGGAPP